VASGIVGGAIATGFTGTAEASGTGGPVGTMIDLTRCDGCAGRESQACVSACRTEHAADFPEPIDDIGDYWPQKKREDWSDKRGLTSRLTPYSWTFVQKVAVEHDGGTHELSVARRCMHCDNPPCAKICPFSAQEKTPEGPVVIDPDLCFGGAKCRDVCPWGIPSRQAGVGLYLKLAPKLAGGGVMYKCDLCHDRVVEGREPACVEACPQGAIVFGQKDEMLARAKTRAQEIDGYIYGENENGGTSTFYVSPVPFEKIHEQLTVQRQAQENPQAPGFPGMPTEVGNFLDTTNGMALSMVVAPVAGLVAAGAAAYRTITATPATRPVPVVGSAPAEAPAEASDAPTGADEEREQS
jgi:Fe-S-cluster-containing dehydrogenase component